MQRLFWAVQIKILLNTPSYKFVPTARNQHKKDKLQTGQMMDVWDRRLLFIRSFMVYLKYLTLLCPFFRPIVDIINSPND